MPYSCSLKELLAVSVFSRVNFSCRCRQTFRVELSLSTKSRVICFIESHLNMMKNTFYFILKALFVLKIFKENAQLVQKVTFEPLMYFKQNHYEVGNIAKAATFKSFLHLSYKNTQLLFQ